MVTKTAPNTGVVQGEAIRAVPPPKRMGRKKEPLNLSKLIELVFCKKLGVKFKKRGESKKK